MTPTNGNGKPIPTPNGHAPEMQRQTLDLRPILKHASEAAAHLVEEMLKDGLDPRYERATYQVAMELFLTATKAQIHVSAELDAHRAMIVAQQRAQGIVSV